jgi:histidinol phosphatase-like enzyme
VSVCPHDEGEYNCRKPDVGILRRAAADCPDIDFASALVVGDSLSDLQTVAAIRSRANLIATGVRRSEILCAAARESLTRIAAAGSLFEALRPILEAGFPA